MRLKAEAILDFGADEAQQPNKIVREYRNEYKTISDILNKHPKILEMAHRDLQQLSKNQQLSETTSRRGRRTGAERGGGTAWVRSRGSARAPSRLQPPSR